MYNHVTRPFSHRIRLSYLLKPWISSIVMFIAGLFFIHQTNCLFNFFSFLSSSIIQEYKSTNTLTSTNKLKSTRNYSKKSKEKKKMIKSPTINKHQNSILKHVHPITIETNDSSKTTNIPIVVSSAPSSNIIRSKSFRDEPILPKQKTID